MTKQDKESDQPYLVNVDPSNDPFNMVMKKEDNQVNDTIVSHLSQGIYDLPDVSNVSSQVLCKLFTVSFICLIFLIAEIFGGIYAQSLAILSDAAHMFSDLSGFFISIFSIWLGKKPASRLMSFGYHRSEVVGALASIILIWALTIFLLYEATYRIIKKEMVEAPLIMVITAVFGLFCNITMAKVLHSSPSGNEHDHSGNLFHQCNHDHGHGGGHGHGGHGHDHGHEHEHAEGGCDHKHDHEGHNHKHGEAKKNKKGNKNKDGPTILQKDRSDRVKIPVIEQSFDSLNESENQVKVHEEQKQNHKHEEDHNCKHEHKKHSKKQNQDQANHKDHNDHEHDHDHGHDHDHNHKHEKPNSDQANDKSKEHKHNVKCSGNHEHDSHEQDHKHDHDHDHENHDHNHNHDHEHDHDHDHKEVHGDNHDHHDHDPDHDHDDGHDHKHDTKPAHKHDQKHDHKHDHKHDGKHDHKHDHSHKHDDDHEHEHDHGHQHKDDHDHNNPGHEHISNNLKSKNLSAIGEADNYNLRSAMIHVIGDLLQSIGVLIAALLIYFLGQPKDEEGKIVFSNWQYADPVCTYLFSVLVLFTTFGVAKECLKVIMEATPTGIIMNEFEDQLTSVSHVKELHDLHIWSLSVGKPSMSVHLVIDQGHYEKVLKNTTKVCRQFGIFHSTIQIEDISRQGSTDYIKCKHNLH